MKKKKINIFCLILKKDCIIMLCSLGRKFTKKKKKKNNKNDLHFLYLKNINSILFDNVALWIR